MIAGLPGIGVGTLFYVLTALWMPIRESVRLVKGESSVERWRLIAVQLFFAASIIASIAIADRVLLWVLGTASPGSFSPARLLNNGFILMSPRTWLAAPIVASLLLLGIVLFVVEAMRLVVARRSGSSNASVDRQRVFHATPRHDGDATSRVLAMLDSGGLLASSGSTPIPEDPAA
jgi:hypothetical protein